jgi:hypothetical protein
LIAIKDFHVDCVFLYLVVIMDWQSRTVLAWRLSNAESGENAFD